tara:strand:+ start:750 stop:947 length:198 start_codon:yes stop_codon:yes gene_type:complete
VDLLAYFLKAATVFQKYDLRYDFRLISVHIPAYLSIRYLEQKIRKRLINFNEIGIFPPPFGEKPV